MIRFENFFFDEDGQGMVEYGLLIGLIAVVTLVLLVAVGSKIKERFKDVNNNIE